MTVLPCTTRHPELVSGSILRIGRSKRWQPQPYGKIDPVRIGRVDEIDLPLAVPALQLLFAKDGWLHLPEQFVVNQAVNVAAAGESRELGIAVLPQAREQVGRHTNVERTVQAAREDIDARKTLLPHRIEFAAEWTLKQVQGDEERMAMAHD